MVSHVDLACRLCAGENLTNLTFMDVVKVNQFFPQILLDDALLPTNTCVSCVSDLEKTFQFYNQVLRADHTLRKIVALYRDDNQGSNQLDYKKKAFHYECPHCKKIVDTKNALRNHVKTEHPNETVVRRYACRICTLDFLSAGQRSEHELVHRDEKPFLCEVCGKMFCHLNNLRIHLNTHSDVRKKYPCDVCQKSFLTRRFLREHKNMHTGIKPYSCETCGKEFQGKGHLRQHRWTHAGQTFQCQFCGKTFNRKGNMSIHVRSRHLNADIAQHDELNVSPNKPVQEKKTILDNQFNQTLPQENQNEDNSTQIFSCKRCKKTFDDESALKQHYPLHVDITLCTLCGKKFKHHGSLTYHRRVAHTGEKPFKCSHCDASFPLKSQVTTHERRAHTGHTPFVCAQPHCGRAFHSAAALRAHHSIHVIGILFTCELCGKGLKRKTSLMAHVKAHFGDPQHKCQVCDKVFRQKCNLIRHGKKHGPESRPFFCKFCGESFFKKSDCGKHALCKKQLLQPIESDQTDLVTAEKILDLVTQNHFYSEFTHQ